MTDCRVDPVERRAIGPPLEAAIALGTTAFADEYDIDARLSAWGDTHRTACHADGESARDDDGDGSCEVPGDTLEGSWSLLRSWLRPHRGSRRSGCRFRCPRGSDGRT